MHPPAGGPRGQSPLVKSKRKTSIKRKRKTNLGALLQSVVNVQVFYVASLYVRPHHPQWDENPRGTETKLYFY